jgi:glycosyltransferase involved in cell wall biosynthesis
MSVGKSSGGAEFVAFRLAEYLADRGEDVVLVSDIDPSMDGQMPAALLVQQVGTYRGLGRLVRLVPMNFPRWLLQHLVGNIRVARRARTLVTADEKGFDVVHVHGALAAVLLRRALRAHGEQIPLVYTEHDSTPWTCRHRRRLEHLVRRGVYRAVNLRACRAATAIVANFPSLADELAVRAGVSRSRFSTVRNATEPEWLGGRQGTEKVKAGYGFDRYFLFVGSLIERKNPDAVLRALAEIRLPCIFVGDGPLRASLERLAAQSGISDRVVFAGAVEHRDVRPYYLGAEALVLPSASEGVPLVVLEALGAGVPIVASNLTGIASVVTDGENGLLVEPGDEAALTRALSILETDEYMRARLRHGAQRSGHAIASWPDVADQLCALYARHSPVARELPVPLEALAELGAPGVLVGENVSLEGPQAAMISLPGQATRA